MFDMVVTYLTQATASDFFAGGLALGVLGLAAATLRMVWGRAVGLVWRRIAVTVSVDNRTDAFRFLSLWLDAEGVLTRTRNWRMANLRVGRTTRYTQKAVLLPGSGRHWFWRDGCLCLIDSSVEEKARVNTGQHQPEILERLTVTLIGAGRERLQGWIDEGRKIAARQTRTGPALHLLKHGYWQDCGDLTPRRLDTLEVEDDRADRLCADMRRFYGAANWYHARGVPWRRGYLLHGPPGTGKSSLIRALATELNRDIATLDIGRRTLGDDELREAMIDAPRSAILVIEDVDAAFTGREGDGYGISFSGLLNAIDGVAAQEGRALVMTTNHRERLDPALIRPGRADCHVELGLVPASVAGAIFARFFPEAPEARARFEAAIGEARLAPAEVQGWLLQHADDPEAAAGAVGLLGQEKLMAAE